MSGIVGIVNLDGRPVDRDLLERMTASLDFRGPDARQVWTRGAVGFGHTLLRTTFEAEHETQPLSFDGETWIVADCRVDAREELIAKLHAKGRRRAALDRPDVELILHAWHVWGEACVEHLLGDFAFAIWDAPNRRLFCARDHMGVKPFYYARRGATVIFSNTLDCVRMHPSVTDRLDDLAIADFLLFGVNTDKATTIRSEVRRLPPATLVLLSKDGDRSRTYWTLPVEHPTYFSRQDEYTEEFNQLLKRAVNDRLRVDRASIYMSGGLDSPILAATANATLKDRDGQGSIHAFTTVVGATDSEGHYGGIAARHIGIPITLQDIVSAPLVTTEQIDQGPRPEPDLNPIGLTSRRRMDRELESHSRVALFGEGPDNALTYEWRAHINFLAKSRRFGRLAKDLALHSYFHRRVPLLTSLPRMAGNALSPDPWAPIYPAWIDPEFEASLSLRERWREYWAPPQSTHPVRPKGHSSFDIPQWQTTFEEFDSARTRTAFEVRHPYLDLRLLSFMLRVPAMPWCRRKFLLRRAARGRLPAELLNRPKTPVPQSLLERRWGELRPLESTPQIEFCSKADWSRYDQRKFDHSLFRVRALAYWLEGAMGEQSYVR